MSKLKALRLVKEEQNSETVRYSKELKKIDVAPVLSLHLGINRRGVGLGPAEIATAVKSRPSNKPDITPVLLARSRRKSCFWKLQEMDELKLTKERRKSFSLTVGPKTRKTVSRTQPPKQAATTVGWKRGVKKEEEVVYLIQPKELFKEGDKSAKRPARPGRFVQAAMLR